MFSGKNAFVMLMAVSTGAMAIAFLTGTVLSGPLDPPGAPAPTMRTLDEIYNKIDGGTSEKSEVMFHNNGQLLGPFDSNASTFLVLLLAGADQGPIAGDITLSGREGSIAVAGIDSGLSQPFDSATGLPTGKRQHKPLTVVKYIDDSSPGILRALLNNEVLSTTALRFFRPTNAGAEEHYFSIELVGGRVVDVQQRYPNLEIVSFTYQSIIWRLEDGGVTAEDSWAQTR